MISQHQRYNSIQYLSSCFKSAYLKQYPSRKYSVMIPFASFQF